MQNNNAPAFELNNKVVKGNLYENVSTEKNLSANSINDYINQHTKDTNKSTQGDE